MTLFFFFCVSRPFTLPQALAEERDDHVEELLARSKNTQALLRPPSLDSCRASDESGGDFETGADRDRVAHPSGRRREPWSSDVGGGAVMEDDSRRGTFVSQDSKDVET